MRAGGTERGQASRRKSVVHLRGEVLGLTLLGPLTSSLPSTEQPETWGSGEVFQRRGWREGGALVTFTFQAHLSREEAGTHLQRQDGSCAPSSAL